MAGSTHHTSHCGLPVSTPSRVGGAQRPAASPLTKTARSSAAACRTSAQLSRHPPSGHLYSQPSTRTRAGHLDCRLCSRTHSRRPPTRHAAIGASGDSGEGDPVRGACCPPDSEPYLAPPAGYVPAGETVTARAADGHSVRVYVVGSGTVGLLVAHDIFGGDSGRHRQLCDSLAAAGYAVAMPDLSRGSLNPRGNEFAVWRVPGMLPSMLGQLGRRWDGDDGVAADVAAAAELLQDRGARRLGALGFCYGAWVVMRASAGGEGLPRLEAGVSVHPSVHNMTAVGVGGASEEEIVLGVHCPQLVLSTGSEPKAWRAGGRVATWLAEAAPGSRVGDLPQGLIHGFATRGDAGKPAVAEGVRLVLEESLAFFELHLGETQS